MEAFRGPVLSSLQTVSACQAPVGTPPECFSKLIYAVLYAVFLPFWVSGIFFGALYGIYYEFIPGHGYPVRAFGLGTAMLVVMLLLGLHGIIIVDAQGPVLLVAELFGMFGYSAVLARYYRRRTREVRFESPDRKKFKISVDGKNFTGKVKTLYFHSTHKLEAVPEEGSFHSWLVSGGVSVLDSRSSTTVMKVDGDGLLKAS